MPPETSLKFGCLFTDLVKDVKANPTKKGETDTDAKKHFLQYVTQVKVQFGSALARDDKEILLFPATRRQLISNFAISNCIRSPVNGQSPDDSL